MAEAAAADASAAAAAAAADTALSLSPFVNLVGTPLNLARVADAGKSYDAEPAAAEPVAVVVVIVAPADDASSSGVEANANVLKASTDDSAELDELEEAALALDAGEGGAGEVESPGLQRRGLEDARGAASAAEAALAWARRAEAAAHAEAWLINVRHDAMTLPRP